MANEIQIERLQSRSMITLKGDLAASEMVDAAKAFAGALPGQGEIHAQGARQIAWMAPDELLLIVPASDCAAALAKAESLLGGAHALAVDVSDARASFALQGPLVRETLAKLTPADLSPEAFPVGRIRRSRIAQIAAAFWMTGPDRAELVCFRSVQAYAAALLEQSVSTDTPAFF